MNIENQKYQDFSKEITRLKKENHQLNEQVRMLVISDAQRIKVQEELDNERSLYRKLADLGRSFLETNNEMEVLTKSLGYIIYYLNYEKCLVLKQHDHFLVPLISEGFYHLDSEKLNQTLKQEIDCEYLSLLLENKQYEIFNQLTDENDLSCKLSEILDFHEYIIFQLNAAPSEPCRFYLILGNSIRNIENHRRIKRENKELHVLVTLVNLLISKLENIKTLNKLIEQKDDVERANRMKSAFLANMTHDLRTPLNGILGFTNLIKKEAKKQLSEKHLKNLDYINLCSNNLLDLINDILDISKVEAGKIDITLLEFDPLPIIKESVTNLRTLAENKRLDLDIIKISVPKMINADPKRLRQILINLLSNAVKFTNSGSVKVLLEKDLMQKKFRISVIDTGIGIEEEELAHIFEPFYQVKSPKSISHRGTGLGLSIVKQLVGLLHGTIKIKSIPDEGTTVIFELPLG